MGWAPLQCEGERKLILDRMQEEWGREHGDHVPNLLNTLYKLTIGETFKARWPDGAHRLLVDVRVVVVDSMVSRPRRHIQVFCHSHSKCSIVMNLARFLSMHRKTHKSCLRSRRGVCTCNGSTFGGHRLWSILLTCLSLHIRLDLSLGQSHGHAQIVASTSSPKAMVDSDMLAQLS